MKGNFLKTVAFNVIGVVNGDNGFAFLLLSTVASPWESPLAKEKGTDEEENVQE